MTADILQLSDADAKALSPEELNAISLEELSAMQARALSSASQTSLTPTFPIEVFPARHQEHAQAIASAVEMETTAPAFAKFGTLSACYGTRTRVELDYVTYCNDYCMMIAKSGLAKTPIFKHTLPPVREIERALQEEATHGVFQARATVTRLKADRDRIVKKYKGTGANELEADIAQIDAEIAELEEVRMPQILLSDVTPEALIHIMGQNGETASMVSGDTPLWDRLLGESSGKPPDLASFLSAYDAEFYRCDRITRDKNHLDRPRLAIIGATQNETMEKLSMRPELMTRGLVPRFFFCVVDGAPVWNDEGSKVPVDLSRACDGDLERLGLLFHTNTIEPFTLSPDAEQLYRDWRNIHKRKWGDRNAELSDIASFARKLQDKVLRWAGLLHALWSDSPGVIAMDDMERALLLVDFAIANYRQVEALAYQKPPMVLAEKLSGFFADRRGQVFALDKLSHSQADCRKVSAKLRDEALDELEARGVIARTRRRTGGRAALDVVVL